MSKLSDLGERRLIDQAIRKYCSVAGNDCAFLDLPGSRLAITTDPVPEPAAFTLAGDSNPYWKGWLLVTINASDLAAAGASPLGFVAAVEAPPEASVEELERLLQGIADACVSEKIEYVGGNLREAKSFSATGTAVGFVPSAGGLSRSNAQVGDLIFSIGKGGDFLERRSARTGWIPGRHTGLATLSPRFTTAGDVSIGPLRTHKGCY